MTLLGIELKSGLVGFLAGCMLVVGFWTAWAGCR